uniref:Uncharacterized protein n=1 Tax=Rhizophora mucronata TaxID=61149 RepID=A0A2P2N4L2_RHIMU
MHKEMRAVRGHCQKALTLSLGLRILVLKFNFPYSGVSIALLRTKLFLHLDP